jgi:hypothetical protein
VPAGVLATSMLRGAVLWALIRAALMLVMRAPLVELHPLAALVGATVVAALAWTDARIMRETLFLSNLGIPPRLAPVTAAATALLLEILLVAVL